MTKRDWAFIGTLFVIPGAAMELSDSIDKLLRHDLVSWWQCAQFFFLTIAAIAAIFEMRKRLSEVLDGSFIVQVLFFSFFVMLICSGVVTVRWMLGYGWSSLGLSIAGWSFLVWAGALAVMPQVEAREEQEKKQRLDRIRAEGGNEAVEKVLTENAAESAGMRALMRDKAENYMSRRFPH